MTSWGDSDADDQDLHEDFIYLLSGAWLISSFISKNSFSMWGPYTVWKLLRAFLNLCEKMPVSIYCQEF